MRLLKIPTLLALCALLNGCAVMSKDDCVYANWHRIGYDIAMEGETDKVGQFNKRAKLCAKHGVTADLEDYEAGYAEGMLAFCEVDNAVKMGVRGKGSALQLCPEEENPGFIAAFDAGYRLHELRREEFRTKAELDRIEGAEYRIRRRINDVRRSLDDSSGEEQRREAQRRVRYLRRDLHNLRYDADAWRQRYYRAKEAADTYQQYLELEYEEI